MECTTRNISVACLQNSERVSLTVHAENENSYLGLLLKGAECSQVVSVPIELCNSGALSRISRGA